MLKRALTFSAMLFAMIPDARALVIAGYNATEHDRFSSGFAGTPVPNTSGSFIGAGYDWSGVGWDPALISRGVTMISDQYFVVAAHWPPGGQVSFYSAVLGTVVTYAVDTGYAWQPAAINMGQPLPDLRVGRLLSPIPLSAGIASYAILDLPTVGDYLGLQTLIYGRGATLTSGSPRIGTNNIEAIGTFDLSGDTISDSIGSFYFDDGAPLGESYFQSGDSSSPTFVPYLGGLALIGTHAGVGTIGMQTVSVDNFIPAYLSEMQAAGIPFNTVPEPARAILLSVAMLVVLGQRQRVCPTRSL